MPSDSERAAKLVRTEAKLRELLQSLGYQAISIIDVDANSIVFRLTERTVH